MLCRTSLITNRFLSVCLFGFSIGLMADFASAEHYAVGDRIEPFTLEDQHGENNTADESVKVILFSRDMEGGDLLKDGLADVAPGYLSEKKAIYVADISAMPGLIAKMFAIPAMRDRPYSILLDRDGTTTAGLPAEEGKASLVFLDRLTVQRIVYVTEAPAVQRELASIHGGE